MALLWGERAQRAVPALDSGQKEAGAQGAVAAADACENVRVLKWNIAHNKAGEIRRSKKHSRHTDPASPTTAALLALQGILLACIEGSHTPRTRFTTHCSALRTRPRGLSGGGAVRARFLAAATGSVKGSLCGELPAAPPPLPSCVSDRGEDSGGGGTRASDLDASMNRLRYSASTPSCPCAPACTILAAAAWLTSSTRSEGTELCWKVHRRTDSDSKPC